MLRDNQSFTCLGKKRLRKSALILEALGDLDELLVSLGLVRVFASSPSLEKKLISFQKELIQWGGFLAGVEKKKIAWSQRAKAIKKATLELKDQRRSSFSLPGKNKPSVFLHWSRVVCRRLERRVVALEKKKYQPLVSYLNQLSGYLFWLAERTKN